MGTISEKLTYLNGTKGKLKESINKFRNGITNQTTFRDYATELDDIYDLLPKIDNTDEELELLNVQNGKLDEFKMYGNTEQITYTGKNLFDNSSSGTAGQYLKSDGTIASGSDNLRYTDYIEIDVNQKYLTMSGIIDQLSVPAICFYDNNKNFISGISFGGDSEKTFEIPTNTKYTRTSYRTTNLQTMMEYGSTATDYEPYVGGIPSPNPDYPQDVKVVTGTQVINIHGKNLFDKDEVFSNGFIDLITGTQNSNVNWKQSNYKKVVPNSNFIASVNTSFQNSWFEYSFYDKNKTWISSFQNSSATSPSNAQYLKIGYRSDMLNEYRNSIQIEENLTATSYEPYHSQDYEISLKSKNLFNKNNANVFSGRISGSNLTINTDDSNRCLYIECEPNTTYTIQKSIISENKFRVGTSNTVPTTSRVLEDAYIADTSGIITLTTSANAHYLIVHFYNTASENTIEQALATIQIEKGSSATTFEAYYNYELCKIADYKDELVKSTGKNLFDSSLFGTFTKNIQFIELTLKPNTTYTLSSNLPTQSSNTSNANLFLLLENESPSSNSNGVKPNVTRSKTTDSTGKLRIGYRDFDNEYDNEATNYWYQLEEKPNATDYEPYGKVWYKKCYIAKIILNGSENWSRVSASNQNYRFRTNVENIKKSMDAVGYSNYFINNGDSYSHEGISGASGNQIYIRWDSLFTEVSDLTNWLSLHNTTVYYVLETPVIIKITETELINQLEAISVFTGINHFIISNSNDVLPSIYVKRLKELDKLS